MTRQSTNGPAKPTPLPGCADRIGHIQGVAYAHAVPAPLDVDAISISRRDALKAVAAFTAASIVTGLSPSALAAGSEGDGHDRRDQLLDDDWRFHRGDAPGAERPDFNDAKWRRVYLPHDWSLEDLSPDPTSDGQGALWGEGIVPSQVGPFDRYRSEGKGATGWVLGGTGWYRKHFASPVGRQVEVRFDGVYMNCDVWLNGHPLGSHPYGYTGFAYDLTPHLQHGGENVLAVRVRNEGRNSRWYSGSGLYRHVWLTFTGEVRVPLWGVFVTTPEVSREAAIVKVTVTIENRGQSTREVAVRVRLLDASNASAGTHEARRTLTAGGSVQTEHTLAVTTPKLWSPARPYLYQAQVELVVEGKTVDQMPTPFGIRKIEVDAAHGLRINGEVIKLRGGCLHHDNGVLGAAAIDRAEERRVELMKASGFNAIRCSHNPPSPAFLDACDQMGIMVIDEAFDQWELPKNPQDYHLYFREWGQRDLASMILRDRNHPSVLFWSIGNEVRERADPPGVEIARQLVGAVKTLDPTRPVTAAVPGFFDAGRPRPWRESDPAFQFLDVAGYNYQWPQYEPDHARHPDRVMMGTETFPIESLENWEAAQKYSYVLGDFVWAGMDYLGEAGIGSVQLRVPAFGPPESSAAPPTAGIEVHSPAGTAFISTEYPWFHTYSGDIDLIGEKKPQSYFRDVVWGRSPLEMAVQRPLPEGHQEILSFWGWSDELRSWTWPGLEGTPLKVRVYTIGDHVRLLLNGKEIGFQPVSRETRLKAEFTVPYAPGELRAIALTKGRPLAEHIFTTTGPPAKLRLRADRQAIRRDRRNLAFITAEVVDQAGNLIPDAVVPVHFRVRGPGELAGAGNANPKDVASFHQARTRTYHGKCLAVVRPNGSAGSIVVYAETQSLPASALTVRVG